MYYFYIIPKSSNNFKRMYFDSTNVFFIAHVDIFLVLL